MAPNDALICADHVIRALAYLDLDNLVFTAMPSTMAQATRCVHSDAPSEQLIGYSMVLAAIANTPGAAQTLIERLCSAVQGQACNATT